MRRPLAVGATLALICVLVISLTTARARQLSAENTYASRLASAQTSVQTSLQTAGSEGVPAWRLSGIQSRKRTLDSRVPPASFPVFGGERVTFYRNQSRAYAELARQVRDAVRTATVSSRAHAGALIHNLGAMIPQGKPLGLDMSQVQTILSHAEVSFSHAVYPSDFDKVSRVVAGEIASAGRAMTARRAQLAAIVNQAGGSRASVAGLVESQTQSVDPQLSLLGLFTGRAGTYRQELTQQGAGARSARTNEAAALAELEARDVLARVRADYAKTVPSKFVLVSTENQSAQMYQDGRVVYSTPVTTGGPELPTDHGVFHIYEKISPFVFHSPWPPDSPYYYAPTPVQYWMPFDGGEGLHDASWRSNFGPGSNVAPTDLGGGRTILGTHGCVNLPNDAAGFVWNWAPLGTTVVVV